MSFPCTRCGQCCQHIDHVELLSAYDRGDGTCIHYQSEVGCAIYDARPLACRVDEGYQVFASERMSLAAYYSGNAKVCNQLQEAADMPLDWRVTL